jgi:predicted HTH domain antitoxin
MVINCCQQFIAKLKQLTIVDARAKIETRGFSEGILVIERRISMSRAGYISLSEAARQLGISTGTLHYYLRRLGIDSKKFDLDKRRYLATGDFERIRALKAAAGTINSNEDAAQLLVCSVA